MIPRAFLSKKKKQGHFFRTRFVYRPPPPTFGDTFISDGIFFVEGGVEKTREPRVYRVNLRKLKIQKYIVYNSSTNIIIFFCGVLQFSTQEVSNLLRLQWNTDGKLLSVVLLRDDPLFSAGGNNVEY